METAFPDGSGPFQQDKAPRHTAKISASESLKR